MTSRKTRWCQSVVLMASAVTVTAAVAQQAAPGGFDVSWHSIDCGGGTSAGGTFQLIGIIGQPDASEVALSGGTFDLAGGFLPAAVPPVPDCVGDANHSGTVNIDDLVIVITSWGMCDDCPPHCAGDTNHNCLVNIDDLVQVITNWGGCP